MTAPILSILTPSVTSRLANGKLDCLCRLIAACAPPDVEHLVMVDRGHKNGGITVGGKRDALLRAARGKYIAFVDDDDSIRPDYVSELLHASVSNPDVITFRQSVIYNGQSGTVEFRLGNPNEPFTPGTVTRRNAWHVCGWRRTLAILSRFPESNYGEDWAFAAPLCGITGLTEIHIPKILHEYHHDAALTEAPPPLTAPAQ